MKDIKEKKPKKQWITATEAAELLGCNTATIYLMVKQRKLKASRLTGSRDLRFRPEWLDAWMEKNVTIPEDEVMPRAANQ